MQCGRSSGSRVPTRSPLGSPDSSLTVTSSRTQRGAAQRACDEATSRVAGSRMLGCTRRPRGAPSWRRSFIPGPTHNRDSTVRHHGPIDLSAELMPPSSSPITICTDGMSIDPSAGPALRVRLAARAASVRAYARPARAWYWKKISTPAVRSPGPHRFLPMPDP